MFIAQHLSINMNVYLMMQTCLLVAMLVRSSVSGPGRDNAREETEREASMDNNIDKVRRADTPWRITCGQKPAIYTGAFGLYDDEEVDKILGGINALRGEVPWQVNMFNGNSLMCGGAIISEFWILTSAKCARAGFERSWVIIVGDHCLRKVEVGEAAYAVEKFIPHELYNESSLDYNIGLVKVLPTSDGRGIQFTNYIQPICLPEGGFTCQVRGHWEASGWGRETATSTTFPDILKRVALLPHDQDYCRSLTVLGTDRISCAENRNTALPIGACFGDEGGPVTCASNGIYALMGVMWHVAECDTEIRPLLFTNVIPYLPWIHAGVARNSVGNQSVLPSRF